MNPRDLDIDATINIPTFQRCHSIGLSDRDLLWHSSSLMRSHYLAIYWKKGLVLEQSISTIHLHNLASTSIGCPRAESLSLALIFFSLLLPTYSHIFTHMISIPRTSFQPSQSFKSFKSLFRFLFWFSPKKTTFLQN